MSDRDNGRQANGTGVKRFEVIGVGPPVKTKTTAPSNDRLFANGQSGRSQSHLGHVAELASAS